jgi:hypothetical protein
MTDARPIFSAFGGALALKLATFSARLIEVMLDAI